MKYAFTTASCASEVPNKRLEKPPTPPNITSQPVADQNATIGSNVTFSVDANGTGLTYQWQKQDANGTWVNIGGATASSYTINSVQSIHAGTYRVAITNASGGTTYSSNSVQCQRKRSFR